MIDIETFIRDLNKTWRELRYEDLTIHPRACLQDLLRFLGLTFCDDVLISSHPQAQAEGKLGSLVPNSGKWRTYFTPEIIERLEKIAGPVLGELGYTQLSSESVHETPAKIRLAYWRVSDLLRALWIQERRRAKRSREKRKWGRLWCNLVVSIRDYRANRL